MKKQLTPTRFVLLVLLLSAAVYIAGCTKSNSSIIGTWIPSTMRSVTKVNNATVNDTTFTMAPSMIGFSSLTFSSSTQYSEKSYPSGLDSTGTYTYTGGILTMTSGPRNGSPKPASVNGNTLVVTDKLDTTSTTPLTTSQYFFTLNRQ